MKATDVRISVELALLVLLAWFAVFGPGIPIGCRATTVQTICPRSRMDDLIMAIAIHQVDTGHLPKSLLGLFVKDGSDNWNGPYVGQTGATNFAVADPWGTPIAYTWNGGAYYGLRSAGPDRTFNTTDDVTRIEKAEPVHAGDRAPRAR
jgi:hypothetical protein